MYEYAVFERVPVFAYVLSGCATVAISVPPRIILYPVGVFPMVGFVQAKLIRPLLKGLAFGAAAFVAVKPVTGFGPTKLS